MTVFPPPFVKYSDGNPVISKLHGSRFLGMTERVDYPVSIGESAQGLWRYGMKIHEYQAKKLLRDYGIPVPRGEGGRDPGGGAQMAAKSWRGRSSSRRRSMQAAGGKAAV